MWGENHCDSNVKSLHTPMKTNASCDVDVGLRSLHDTQSTTEEDEGEEEKEEEKELKDWVP